MSMTTKNNGFTHSKQKLKKGSEMLDKYVKPVEEERRKSDIIDIFMARVVKHLWMKDKFSRGWICVIGSFFWFNIVFSDGWRIFSLVVEEIIDLENYDKK